MNIIKSKKVKLKTKRIFMKKGTCSRALYYILNREFGNSNDPEEQAVDPLAGGILQQGYQCGLLWGALFAVGAESYRRFPEHDKAIGMGIKASRYIVESFVARAKSTECEDIIGCDIKTKKKFNLVKIFFTGKFINCFRLAGKWAPQAIESAKEGLDLDQTDLPGKPLSCASEVVRKMGGSDREMVIVSGLAGGLGLCGSGCGALGALIWMNTLDRIKKETYKPALSDPVLEKILKTFYEATDYEMECQDITGRSFKTIEGHTEFIKKGGCSKLIDVLAGYNAPK